jgi:hypothetical protein
MPVENAPRPVAADPVHPYVPNAIEYLSSRPNMKVVEQSTFPVADLTNPILQPWVRDELRKLNERYSRGSRCSSTKLLACGCREALRPRSRGCHGLSIRWSL